MRQTSNALRVVKFITSPICKLLLFYPFFPYQPMFVNDGIHSDFLPHDVQHIVVE